MKSPAKINLTLEILGRLPNGYHELATIFQTTDLSDEVSVQFDSDITVLKCEHPDVPTGEKNLILKAVRAVEKFVGHSIPCSITLAKVIPMGAGLGGGSSNAATMLLLLGKRFAISKPELFKIATSLGADVPFFLMGGTALASGIGEKLEPLPSLGSYHLVIVKPAVSISTAEAYAKVKQYSSGENTRIVSDLIKSNQMEKIFDHLTNDFEPIAFSMHPELVDIKKMFLEHGALAAQMSGSGSAFFAFARNENHANDLAMAVSIFGKTWVTSTGPLTNN